MVRHKNTSEALKIKYHTQILVLGAFLSKMWSPRRVGNKTPPNCKHPNMFGSYRLYNGFTHLYLQGRCNENTKDAFKHVPDLL